MEEEWPRLAREERSPRTDAALDALLREVARPRPGMDASVQRTMQDMQPIAEAAMQEMMRDLNAELSQDKKSGDK